MQTLRNLRKTIFYIPLAFFFSLFYFKFEYHEIYQKFFFLSVSIEYAIIIIFITSLVLSIYISWNYFKSSGCLHGVLYLTLTALFFLPILFISICKLNNLVFELYISGLYLTVSFYYIFFCAASSFKINQQRIFKFDPGYYYFSSFFFLTLAYYVYHSYLIGIVIEWYNSRPSLINKFPITYLFVDHDKIFIDFLLSVGVFLFVFQKMINEKTNIMKKKDVLYVFVISIITIMTLCFHIFCIKKILPYNYNIQGYTLAKEGSFSKASKLLEQVLIVKPFDINAQLNYGITLFIKNEYQPALNIFNKILRIDPENEIAHTQAGILYLKQNKIEKAIKHFEKVLKLNPKSIKAHEKMGFIRYSQRNVLESTYHFERVRELNPNDARSYLNLAIVASHSGRLNQSIKLLKDSLFIEPLNVEVHDNLGAALVSTGNIEEAIRHFYIALQLNPEYKQAQQNIESITKGIFNLARKFEEKQKYDKAIEMYTKLSTFRPDWSAYMYFNIGKIYSKLSKAGKSVCWFKKAVDINVDLWDVFEDDKAYSFLKKHSHFKSVLLKRDSELLICDKEEE